MSKKQYSLKFKCEVIMQALETSPSYAARQNRLNSFTIYRWIKEYKEGKYNSIIHSRQSKTSSV